MSGWRTETGGTVMVVRCPYSPATAGTRGANPRTPAVKMFSVIAPGTASDGTRFKAELIEFRCPKEIAVDATFTAAIPHHRRDRSGVHFCRVGSANLLVKEK